MKKIWFLLGIIWIISAHSSVWNRPYSTSMVNDNIYFSSFSEQPKTLDPAKSYSSNEFAITANVYEAPLQYVYNTHPYQLTPLATIKMPEIIRDKDDKGHDVIRYRISLRHDMWYHPHPAFAKDKKNKFYYIPLSPGFFDKHDIHSLKDFRHLSIRQVVADDYIYQIKRMANPAINSPLFGLLSQYILGFEKFGKQLPDQSHDDLFIDLRKYPMEGLKKIDDFTFEIILKEEYPQFIYWLTLPFFSPIPWEADAFYGQDGMAENNLGFSWYPVGSGPFILDENNPNRRMTLIKNPHYYEPGLPKIDEAYFVLEKEAVPRWNKFMQGYYDASGIATDNFDEAIYIDDKGQEQISPSLAKKSMKLVVEPLSALYYLGFNMLDPVIGGDSSRSKYLRQAIAIAVDYEEYISIFNNGRGVAAQGPIPNGLFGVKEGKSGMNPVVYQWKNGHAVRKSIETAKYLMQKAGYKNGIDPKTHRPLILHYDVAVTGGPDDKAILDWYRKQFAKLGIVLHIRPTLYNQFQDKLAKGNAQIFSWGWMADYPDPENFLYSLYGPNSKVKLGGENAANYKNKRFDSLYHQMKSLPNGDARQAVIDEMVNIVRDDSPWLFGITPTAYVIQQSWLKTYNMDTVVQNGLKYLELEPKKRYIMQQQWNKPVIWPFFVISVILVLFLLPGFMAHVKRERSLMKRYKP